MGCFWHTSFNTTNNAASMLDSKVEVREPQLPAVLATADGCCSCWACWACWACCSHAGHRRWMRCPGHAAHAGHAGHAAPRLYVRPLANGHADRRGAYSSSGLYLSMVTSVSGVISLMPVGSYMMISQGLGTSSRSFSASTVSRILTLSQSSPSAQHVARRSSYTRPQRRSGKP